MRRSGVRREAGDRVCLRTESGETAEGWMLNVSRGGVRLIVEGRLELGQVLTVESAEQPGVLRSSRVAWVQEEPDGVVVGLEFIGSSEPPPEAS